MTIPLVRSIVVKRLSLRVASEASMIAL